MIRTIPYGHHWLDEEDIAEVVKTLRSDWITQGPRIQEFEESVASYCGARFGAAFSSGTAALHAACFAAGIGSGDQVVTTPLTFVATANAVLYQGGVPVFADIDTQSLNIDPDAVTAKITPKTRAILPVHFAGLPAAIGRLRELAARNRLIVIEDACHALGASWVTPEGRSDRVGSCRYSDMTVLSFHPVKHITTGEGGMCLTNDEAFYKKLILFRHHGIAKSALKAQVHEPWHDQMQVLGFNYRVTDFQCALGLSQLKKLDRFLKRRREIAARYQEAFSELGLVTQREERFQAHAAWHLYVVKLPLERLSVDRAQIFQTLRRQGLGVSFHYLPVHLHPFYREQFSYRPGDFPVSEDYFNRALTLPLYPKMSDEEVEWVIQKVSDVLRTYERPKARSFLSEMRTS